MKPYQKPKVKWAAVVDSRIVDGYWSMRYCIEGGYYIMAAAPDVYRAKVDGFMEGRNEQA